MSFPLNIRVSLIEGASIAYDRRWNYRHMNSPFARLYHVSSGRGVVEHHGRTFSLVPGPLYLIPSRTESHYACPNRMHLDWVHVTVLVNGALDLFALFEPAYVVAPGRGEAFGGLFRQMLEAAAHPGIGSRMKAEGIATHLLARFLEAVPVTDQEARLAPMRRFEPVVAFMRENLARPLTLSDLAGQARLHPTYFSNQFARVMGLPPIEMLVRLRVEKAEELLWFTDLQVKQVAAATGFRDEFYFSRQFRKVAGYSPQQYRRNRMTVPPEFVR
ncbi:MAG: AraC family transcriptional regulator [bacterium]